MGALRVIGEPHRRDPNRTMCGWITFASAAEGPHRARAVPFIGTGDGFDKRGCCSTATLRHGGHAIAYERLTRET